MLVKTVTVVANLRGWGNRCHLLFKENQGHISEEHVGYKILLWQMGKVGNTASKVVCGVPWQEIEEVSSEQLFVFVYIFDKNG